MIPVIRKAFPLLALAAAAARCVPEGPATGSGPSASKASPVALVGSPPPDAEQAAPLDGAFEDRFDRATLGSDWVALSPAWVLRDGKLCVKGARNHGVWLRRAIPVNARIEFEATTDSPDGDMKVELWGDGKSGATGTSYTNATSYLAILGGWKNTKHVLARLDEHGADRLELDVDPLADDERLRPIAPGQPYHFQIERSDGKTVEMSVNGQSYFTFSDSDPLAGSGHDHVGFNDWDTPVCFDDLKVTPL